jgi:hypothetical protein
MEFDHPRRLHVGCWAIVSCCLAVTVDLTWACALDIIEAVRRKEDSVSDSPVTASASMTAVKMLER